MSIAADAIKERMANFKETLERCGIKITHQRIEIFREVASNDIHPDADTVFKGVRKRLPTISLDTVYRTLWLFLDLGLINTLGFCRERVRFDANTLSHHHFVCSNCGMTSDFYHPEFDQLQAPDSVKALGDIKQLQVEISGICTKCMKKKEKTI